MLQQSEMHSRLTVPEFCGDHGLQQISLGTAAAAAAAARNIFVGNQHLFKHVGTTSPWEDEWA